MLINQSEKRQFLTSLPNANSKQIDYVIKFKQQISTEHKLQIDAFFVNIESKVNKIEIVYLNVNKNNNEKFTYALLHFPLDRLLEEAESIKLEMNLKQVLHLRNISFSSKNKLLTKFFLKNYADHFKKEIKKISMEEPSCEEVFDELMKRFVLFKKCIGSGSKSETGD